jgi:glycosyl-4,4'-diaponeurosporenoate acyltransferase
MTLDLPGQWAIAINVAVWLVIHLGVSISTARMQPESFDPHHWLYRQRSRERDGRIYRGHLKVKRWKRLLPDGAVVFRGGFRKKRLANADPAYIERFIRETCRAELTHWAILLLSFIFFIWNEWWIGMIMVAYGSATNVPCIITQRYNRIRLRRILWRTTRHNPI